MEGALQGDKPESSPEGRPPEARFAHRPCHRLHSGADYERVYKAGVRAGDSYFAVNVRPNGLGYARLGMSIGGKTVGNAVRRNRVRRMLREFFRHRRAELPPLDFVVTSRPGAREASRADLIVSVERLMKVAIRKASQDTPRSPANAPQPDGR